MIVVMSPTQQITETIFLPISAPLLTSPTLANGTSTPVLNMYSVFVLSLGSSYNSWNLWNDVFCVLMRCLEAGGSLTQLEDGGWSPERLKQDRIGTFSSSSNLREGKGADD